MAQESVSQRTNALRKVPEVRELQKLIEALRLDIVQLRAANTVLCAKLDLDAGVTDVNYTALVVTAQMGTVNTIA